MLKRDANGDLLFPIRSAPERYFYAVDARRLDVLASCFTADASMTINDGQRTMTGRDAIVEAFHHLPFASSTHLVTSQDLGEHTGLPQNTYRWRVAMARVRQAYGDLDGALDLLQDAERLYVGDFFPSLSAGSVY